MPLNSIPATTTVSALQAKRDAARGKTAVNVEYIGGVVPGNSGELEGLHAAGVRAFKCFLAPSGVDEFPAVIENDLRKAFPILARIGLPLMVHAEDPERLANTRKRSRFMRLPRVAAVRRRNRRSPLVRLLEWCPTL